MVANPSVRYTNIVGENTLRVEIQLITTIVFGHIKTLARALTITPKKVFYQMYLHLRMRMAIGGLSIWTTPATTSASATKSSTTTAIIMAAGSHIFSDSSLPDIVFDTRFYG